MPDLSLETALRSRGFLKIAGIDEAGRGPLAGPVAAAAVILPDGFTCEGGAGEALDLHAMFPGIAAGLDQRVDGIEIPPLHLDIGCSLHGSEAIVAIRLSCCVTELLFTFRPPA